MFSQGPVHLNGQGGYDASMVGLTVLTVLAALAVLLALEEPS